MRQKGAMLMICYYFPPIHSIGVLRNYALQSEFKRRFKQVHVFTTNNRGWMQKDVQPIVADSISELPTFDYRSIGKIVRPGKVHHAEINKSKWSRALLNVNNSFPFNLIFGEGGLIYIISGFLKAVKLVNRHEITHVYSSFTPYADHVIAYLLRLFYPKLIWIADFRDVHVDPIYKHVVFFKFQHWVNKVMIQKATIVTTVSNGLATYLKRYNNKVFVIRNGFFNSMQDEPYSIDRPNKFTISYTGSMVKTERDPEPLLKTLRKLMVEQNMDADNLQICYAGKDGKYWSQLTEKYGLRKNLVNYGLIERSRASQIQKQSHINLLLTSSHPELQGILTGKLIEYLQAGKPILAIVNGPTDAEIEELFDELNAGLVVNKGIHEAFKIEEFLLDRYSKWLRNEDVKQHLNEDALKKFQWDIQVDMLFANAHLQATSSV